MTFFARTVVFLVAVFPLSSSITGCSLHKYPMLDTRTTKSVLADYEQSAYPKDVIRYLFRHGRKRPAQDELLEVAKWSLEHRIMFIRLVDKLKGDYKEAFLVEFSEALSSSEYRQPFETEFATSAAPSVKRILNQLQERSNDVASSVN